MSDQNAKSVTEASIAVTVIRADGTREDHGIVSYYHKNPLKRAAFELKKKMRERK